MSNCCQFASAVNQHNLSHNIKRPLRAIQLLKHRSQSVLLELFDRHSRIHTDYGHWSTLKSDKNAIYQNMEALK